MLKLTTTVYKYKSYAPLIVIMLVVVTLLFFFLFPISPLFNIIAVITLITIAIYASLKPASVFSPRSVDERKLTLMPASIVFGDLHIPVTEAEKLDLYIHAFDTFRHLEPNGRGGKMITTEYGDKNKLSFFYHGTDYDLTFYLGTFEHYETLLLIIESWRSEGTIFSARSAFTDSYIREHVNTFAI